MEHINQNLFSYKFVNPTRNLILESRRACKINVKSFICFSCVSTKLYSTLCSIYIKKNFARKLKEYSCELNRRKYNFFCHSCNIQSTEITLIKTNNTQKY